MNKIACHTKDETSKLALVYCRVSTRNQEDNYSLDTQADACVNHAESLGYTVARVTKEIYSGAELFDRPLLSQDRMDLRAGKFQALVCYSIDRLSRDIAHLAIIADECDRVGVEMIFVTEQLDSSPEGKLLQSVRAYVAEIERQKIRERTMRGRKARVLSGKIHNAGSEFYGYRRDKEKGVREIYEPEAAIIRRIFYLYVNEGMSMTALTRLLNQEGIPAPGINRNFKDGRQPIWSKGTVRYLLKMDAYKGDTVVWRYTTQKRGAKASTRIRDGAEHIRLPENITPAIVPVELWDQAQALMKARGTWKGAQKTRNLSRPALLRGLVFCADCGGPLYFSSQKGSEPRYRCQRNNHDSFGRICNGRSTVAEIVEAWVWEQVTQVMQNPKVIQQELQRRIKKGPDRTLLANLKACETQLEKLERGQQRLVKQMMVASDDLTELIERELGSSQRQKEKLTKEMEELKARLTAQEINHENLKSIASYCQHVSERLAEFDFDSKRMLVEALGVSVKVSGYAYEMDMHLDTEGNLTFKSGVSSYPSKSSQRLAAHTAHQRPGWPTRWLLKASA